MANPTLTLCWSNKSVYELVGSWSQHVAIWMSVSHRSVQVMRYEDMLKSPVKVFVAVVGFQRFKPATEQLQRAIEKSSSPI
jgi:hypothetical protein